MPALADPPTETREAYVARWRAAVTGLWAEVEAWAAAHGWEAERVTLRHTEAGPPAGQQLHLIAPPADRLPEWGRKERIALHAGEPAPDEWREPGEEIGVGVDYIPDPVYGSLERDDRGWWWTGPDLRRGKFVPWTPDDIPRILALFRAESAKIGPWA